MLEPPETVSIAFVHGVVSGLPVPARTVDDWLVAARIAPHLLHEPAARVTVEQFVAFFAGAMEALDDEFLGLLSRPLRRGTLALLLRSTLGAATLDHALHRLGRTFRLLQPDLEIEHVVEGPLAGLRLRFHDSRVAARPFLHELLMRVFWRVVAWLHGGRLRPARFDFAFAMPSHVDDYARVFPGEVRFDASSTTVWFAAAERSVPMLRDEAALKAFVAQAPRIVIVPRRSEHAMGARVRGYLQRTRPAWPDLATTAEALHLSTSTLQRHLAAEGANFQALKDRMRRDLAIERLNTSDVPLRVVADELGFADSAAFQRAFKAWTGSAPGAYRRSR